MSAASFNNVVHFLHSYLTLLLCQTLIHCKFYHVFSQVIPLDMYVFYTNTHIKHWDL